jgi:hypothetical protein
VTRPSSFDSEDVTEVRHGNRILLVLAFPLLVGIVAALMSSSLSWTFSQHFALVVLAFLASIFALPKSWRPLRQRTRVRASASGLTIGDRFFPSAAIRRGFVVRGHPVSVSLSQGRFRQRLHLEVGTVEEARSLLRALRLDASQTVVEFRTRSALTSIIDVLFTAGVVVAWFAFTVGGALFAVICATVPLFFVTRAVSTSLSVGADGIALPRLWRRRFLGYGAIVSVTRYQKKPRWWRGRRIGLTVTLRSGEEVLVPLEPDGGDQDCSAVEERIREAMTAFDERDSATDAALVRRGQRSFHDWVTALRALGAGANADLRTAPVPRDRLFRIVEDAGADPTDRVAAAVALGGDRDDESRARLRSAVDATVAPGLRVALEKAAGGESEAEIEAALAAVDGEAPKVRRA